MKTNIRLLLAVAAMLAAPALGAQTHRGHSSSHSSKGRTEKHTTVSRWPSHHSDARPGKPDAHRHAPQVRREPVPPMHHHHVTVRPSHAITRIVNGILYYFWDNCYYRYANNAYYVCDPPVGAIVYELPTNYDIITLNGIRYYRVYNTLYNLIVDAYGKPAFEVVGYLNA